MSNKLDIKLTQNSPETNDLIIHLKNAFDQKKYHLAARDCLKMIRIQPDNTTLYMLLGFCLRQLHKYNSAILILKQFYVKNPNEILMLNELGILSYLTGKFEDAVTYYSKMLSISPSSSEAKINLAKSHVALKQYQEALTIIENALALNIEADRKILLTLKGKLLVLLERFQEGYAILTTLQQENINDVNFHEHYAVSMIRTHQYQEATEFLNKSIIQFKNNAALLNLLGTVISYQRALSQREAAKYFIKALRLSPQDPKIFINLINALIAIDKLSFAKQLGLRAHQQHPKIPQFKITLAVIDILTKKTKEAIKTLENIPKRPELLNDIYANLGIAHLILGHFEKGLALYEYRLNTEKFSFMQSKLQKKRWTGENLDGKKLLIVSEQGLGDTLQFCRYIPLISKGTGQLIVECPFELLSLLQSLENVDFLIDRNNPSPPHDLCTPLLSLPYIFKTRNNAIPANVPYLKAPQILIEKWRQYFSPYQHQLKIGITWAGNRLSQHDKARSTYPHYFKKLCKIPHVCLVSLQKGEPPLDTSFPILQIAENLTDFSETAACISALDLIIGVDTAIIHLAGALNKPVWTLLKYAPDWRWQLDRTDSPWYPSMKLFRQPKRHDWESVFKTVFEMLKKERGMN